MRKGWRTFTLEFEQEAEQLECKILTSCHYSILLGGIHQRLLRSKGVCYFCSEVCWQT